MLEALKILKNTETVLYHYADMKLIPHTELKIPMCGRSFESTLFLASHDVNVIPPELCCVVLNVLCTWGLSHYVNLYAK
jgi:hypothetical protein